MAYTAINNAALFIASSAKRIFVKFSLPMMGAIVFVTIFSWVYSGIDANLYQFRDDGVITMSHARNWVEYGFIGVNPSGDRVEGFSSPLQFLLFALAYAIAGVSYKTFASNCSTRCREPLAAPG